jgi:uncharacterized SAM-dependent methyltransferase
MFLQDSIDLFKGTKTSHMGPHQYVPHNGMRKGKPTSGDRLWAETETRHNVSSEAMFNAETTLLRQAATEIGDYLPIGLPVVDLGPGTVQAFRNKVLPLMRSLRSGRYIPVDESIGFLQDLMGAEDIKGKFEIHPLIDDFFVGTRRYSDEMSLVCSFGSIISNIENPISEELPEKSLAAGLVHLAAATNHGALLIAFDSSQDGESIKAYYQLHTLFQLNIFDRMAVELPLQNFDPLAFDYEPFWIPSSGQLAHMAVVNKDISFQIGEERISLKRGQRLHLKNSYKFTNEFFEKICLMSGFEIMKLWENTSKSKAYLLKLPPHLKSNDDEENSS